MGAAPVLPAKAVPQSCDCRRHGGGGGVAHGQQSTVSLEHNLLCPEGESPAVCKDTEALLSLPEEQTASLGRNLCVLRVGPLLSFP